MKNGIDKKVINISEIARRLGLSQSYTSEIINGVRTGPRAQKHLLRIKNEITKNVKLAA